MLDSHSPSVPIDHNSGKFSWRHSVSAQSWWRYVLTNPCERAGYNTKSIFKRRFEFRVFLLLDWLLNPRLSPRCLPYYLPTAGGNIIGSILFSSVLTLCEIKTVLSEIWTRVVGLFSTTLSIAPWIPLKQIIVSVLFCWWLHGLDVEKNPREKARWELHSDAVIYFERILEAVSYSCTATYFPSHSPSK